MTVYIVMYEHLDDINVDSVWVKKAAAERAVKDMSSVDSDYHFWIIEHPVIGT